MNATEIFQGELNTIGISDQNRTHNLFEYSSMSMQALDFAASAAGRLDQEAARLLRMAYQMMRFRVDKLLELSLFGEVQGAAKFAMAKMPLPLHSYFIHSGAAIAAMQGENSDPLLEGIDIALSDSGDPVKIEGDLIYGLAVIIRSERVIHKADPEQLAITVSAEEKEVVAMLQIAAASIMDAIVSALDILKNKLLERQALYVCENCGFQSLAPNEEYECPLCASKRGTVCYRPFPKISKETGANYQELIRA